MSRAHESYGQRPLTWVDRFGVWLSRRAILRCLPSTGKLRILDVGCGFHASQLRALDDRLEQGVGLDFAISPDLRTLPNYEFHEGTVEALLPTLPRESFDAVLMISVLEHLREPEAALREAHALLKPGGTLLVNVPTWRGKWWLELSAFRFGLSPAVEMDDHKMYYDLRDLWPLLVRVGFRPSRLHLHTHKFGLNLFARAIRTPRDE